MRAAFLTARQRLDVRDVDLPALADDEVLVDVVACGVCGSNLHDWHRDVPPPMASQTPGAIGHEVSGRVAAVGAAVPDLAPGAVVAVEPSAARACLACQACREGATWFCATPRGVAAYGFAEQMVVPRAAAFAVPAGVDAIEAALAEPIACGVHAVRHSWTAGGDGRVDGVDVVVIGAGMLGLAAVMAARHLGAAGVTAVARYPHQAAAAEAAGADSVVDAGDPDLVQTLRRRRARLVVEAVGGRADTFELALSSVAWRGEVVCVGSFEQPQPIDTARAVARETRLFFPVSYASLGGVHDYDVALELMAGGRFPLAGLATHRFALEEVEAAFRTADDKRSGALRVMVTPG